MYAQIENAKVLKSKIVVNAISQRKRDGDQGLRIMDYRSKNIAIQNLTMLSNARAQAMSNMNIDDRTISTVKAVPIVQLAKRSLKEISKYNSADEDGGYEADDEGEITTETDDEEMPEVFPREQVLVSGTDDEEMPEVSPRGQVLVSGTDDGEMPEVSPRGQVLVSGTDDEEMPEVFPRGQVLVSGTDDEEMPEVFPRGQVLVSGTDDEEMPLVCPNGQIVVSETDEVEISQANQSDRAGNESSEYEQVDYKTSSKARFARRQRRKRPKKGKSRHISGSANITTLKLRRKKDSRPVYVNRKSQGFVKGGHNAHSESMVKKSREQEFPESEYEVEGLFTERSPCNRAGYNCATTCVPEMVKSRGNVSYSVDYQNGTQNDSTVRFIHSEESAGETSSESSYSVYYDSDFNPLNGELKSSGDEEESGSSVE